MIKSKLLAVIALLCGSTLLASADPVILISPQDYQVYAISPNGKWACGAYNDYSNTDYGFRWNLETGVVELLSTTTSSLGWSISDDGVVAGTFTDDQVLGNGTPVLMAGYWKDGNWHHLEMPAGVDGAGKGFGISTDGHYMSGYVSIGGIYNPYIWKDGKIFRDLSGGFDGIPWCIAPDGLSAAGWGDPSHSFSRRSIYWAPDGTTKYLSDADNSWCGAQKFSPDGKKILFWGGWNEDETEWARLAAIYDVETGKVDSIPALTDNGELSVFGISNSYTVVGSASGGGFIYKDGKIYDVMDYLEDKGVDFDNMDIATVDDKIMVVQAAAISADDNRIVLCYYDDEGALRSMVVILDQKIHDMAPVDVSAAQLPGINSVRVAWSKSALATDPQGYNVYRGGVKLNAEPINALKYYDQVAAVGTYTYTVTAVYGDKEIASEDVSVSVAEQPLSAPRTVFTRQKGVNGALVQWMAPATNFIGRTYVDMATADIQGFGVSAATSFEVAIGFDKDEIANYAGNKITKVSFYPMDASAYDWKLNLYTRGADGALSLLASQAITQPLNYNAINTITLDNPLDVPDGDLIVAVETSISTASNSVIGMDYGHSTSGYSDLLRQTSEKDFYSLVESSTASGYPYYVSWLITVVLAPEDASEEADIVDHYTVYVDDEAKGETRNTSYVLGALADGVHTLGVSATYADGKTSDVASAELSIAARHKAVDNVFVNLNGDNAIKAWWLAPVDDDDTFLTYASGEPSSRGLQGPAENNYGFMASAVYPPSMLKGYDGYRVNSFRFYPTADALFTFSVEKDDVTVYEQEVDNYVLGHWNTINLSEPFIVDENSTYRLVLDCYDVTPEQSPLAIDNGVPREFLSDAYSLDWASWSSISETGLRGNWMLGWTMSSVSGEPLEVSGYDVLVDGIKVNQNMVTETNYSCDLNVSDGKDHSVSVDVYYPALSESVKGEATYFTLPSLTGIDNGRIEKINLRQGSNYLRVDGDGVKAVEAYSVAGVKAASAVGNTLDITNLSSGIYVVRIKTGDGEFTRKIEIRK